MANIFFGNAVMTGSQETLSELADRLDSLPDITAGCARDMDEDWLPAILPDGENRDDSLFYEFHSLENGKLSVQFRGRNDPGHNFWQYVASRLNLTVELHSSDEMDEETIDETLTPEGG